MGREFYQVLYAAYRSRREVACVCPLILLFSYRSSSDVTAGQRLSSSESSLGVGENLPMFCCTGPMLIVGFLGCRVCFRYVVYECI